MSAVTDTFICTLTQMCSATLHEVLSVLTSAHTLSTTFFSFLSIFLYWFRFSFSQNWTFNLLLYYLSMAHTSYIMDDLDDVGARFFQHFYSFPENEIKDFLLLFGYTQIVFVRLRSFDLFLNIVFGAFQAENIVQAVKAFLHE